MSYGRPPTGATFAATSPSPIAFFAFSAICIACCVRTRNPFLRVACLLGTGGGLVVLYFVGALFFQS